MAGYLERHPQVYMCPIKEPNYFSQDIDTSKFEPFFRCIHQGFNIQAYLAKPELEKMHLRFVQDWSQYRQLFREVSGERVIGEASTSYLYSKVAAKEIKKRVPDAKIIIILRNPMERAFSHYRMDCAGGGVSGQFTKAFKKDVSTERKGWGITHLYRELGLYHDQVKRYIDTFPKKQIRIYFYDDWAADNAEVLKDLSLFLGIDGFGEQEHMIRNKVERVPVHGGVLNFLRKSGVRSITEKFLPESSRALLKSVLIKKARLQMTEREKTQIAPYFTKDIQQLERLLNKNLSWM